MSATTAVETAASPVSDPGVTLDRSAVATRAGMFLLIVAQLLLVLFVVRTYSIAENFGFVRILPILCIGFVVHALLPARLKLPFFLGLSLTVTGLVLGAANTAWLVSLGVLLIVTCHLALPVWMRLVMLCAGGMLLAAIRGQLISSAVPLIIFPILGSMFMFRLLLYFYHVVTDKRPDTVWMPLSYFFLLPNVCFPLFPIIDYDTFRRTHYNADALQIYQKGIHWIVRGTMHILCYRIVYHYFTAAQSDVTNLGQLTIFLVSSYLLYLRISGQFHLIIGVLSLFGFNLPETHHFFFMATGFNDLWRRINIYWKDFTLKLFYLPIFLHLRRVWPGNAAMGISIFSTILITWMLHSYQWFWLRGSFPIRPVDGAFWLTFAVLQVINGALQDRLGSKKALSSARTTRKAVIDSLKGTAMFALMCLLWSFITSPTIQDWLYLMAVARRFRSTDILLVAGLMTGLFLLFCFVNRWLIARRDRLPPFRRSVALTVPSLLLLFVAGLPAVSNAHPLLAEHLPSLATDRLNQRDQDTMDRGYYEQILGMEQYLGQLWKQQLQAPPGWNAQSPILDRDTGEPFLWELRPNLDTTFKRGKLTSNQWGMRDKEYTLSKPEGTYRIAMLGGSATMGAGVDDDCVFEALLENKLNETRFRTEYERFEVLNFSVSGYSLIRRLMVCDRKMFDFDPDAAFYISVGVREPQKVVDRLIAAVHRGIPFPYEELRSIQAETGVRQGMPDSEIRRRLSPYRDDLVRWGYRSMVERCRRRGVIPVWIYMPNTRKEEDPDQLSQYAEMARDAGFVTLSMGDAYRNVENRQLLMIAPWDAHPSAMAHRLLAESLYDEILEHSRELGIDSASEPAANSPKPDTSAREQTTPTMPCVSVRQSIDSQTRPG